MTHLASDVGKECWNAFSDLVSKAGEAKGKAEVEDEEPDKTQYDPVPAQHPCSLSSA